LGALTTNHINSIIGHNKLITGYAYGPVVDYDNNGATEDLLQAYVDRLFTERAGYVDVLYVDARYYHDNCGVIVKCCGWG